MQFVVPIVIGVFGAALGCGIVEALVEKHPGAHRGLVLLGGIAGALLGAADLEIAGAISGAAVGGIAAYFAGGVLVGLVGAFSPPAKQGPVDEAGEPAQETPASPPPRVSVAGMLGGLLARLVGVALLVVLAHETYWVVNVGALASDRDLAARITQATYRGDSRESLRHDLRNRRWMVAVFTARPLRWCISEKVSETNHGVLQFIDFLDGRGPEPKEPQSWKEILVGTAAEWFFQSDNLLVEKAANHPLNMIGTAICRATEEQVDECLARTWFLRYVPTEKLFGEDPSEAEGESP